MQPLKPYVFLKKISSQYKAFFTIGIPVDFRAVGLDSPVDNTTEGVRTYKYHIEPFTGSNAEVISSNTALHSQPSNISKIKILLVEDNGGGGTDKGETTTNYQDADEMG